MKLRKRRPYHVSDDATTLPPRFLPGDPVVLDDGTSATVEYARRDGQVCVMLPSGKREWQHQDCLQWPASFTPLRRR